MDSPAPVHNEARLRQPELTEPRQVAPRFDTIDLLRGCSILAVILLHSSLWLMFGKYKIGTSLPALVRDVVFRQGGDGVSVFFAISGFLITYVSVKRFGSLAAMRAGAFYSIRFARIMPMLLLLLAVLSTFHLAGWKVFDITHRGGTLPGALFSALTFHLNWYEVVHGYLPAPWTVLWSLSVEEMFYVFFPLLCIALLRRRWTRPVFFAVLGGLILFGPFARQPWYSTSEVWLEQSYLGNLDNVALGCLFALLTVQFEKRRHALRPWVIPVMQAVGVVLTLFIVVWDWPRVIFGWHVKRMIGRTGLDVTILGLGICLIMLSNVLRGRCGQRWTAPMRWLGRYSYEVYLTHEFVVMGVMGLFLRVRRGRVGVWVTARVLLAAVLGALLSRFISEPLNRRLRGAPVPARLNGVESPLRREP